MFLNISLRSDKLDKNAPLKQTNFLVIRNQYKYMKIIVFNKYVCGLCKNKDSCSEILIFLTQLHI